MKRIIKFTLILSLLVSFSSCKLFLPDNYKAIKNEYKLSKIMSRVRINATRYEIITAEAEARADRMLEISQMDKNKREEFMMEIDELSTEFLRLLYSIPDESAINRISLKLERINNNYK